MQRRKFNSGMGEQHGEYRPPTCRQYKLVCLALRAILIEMAQRWLRLAQQAEKNDKTELIYEPPMPRIAPAPPANAP
jgi:hypothetical protein